MKLDGDEAELVAAEAAAAAQVLAEPRRTEAAQLADAARAGEVPADLEPVLTEILGASIKGGRARRLYRAEGEKSLTGVLLRSPAGQGLRAEVDGVNAALAPLSGRRLDSVRVAMRRPGSYTLSLQSEGVAITLALTSDAVSVESLTA